MRKNQGSSKAESQIRKVISKDLQYMIDQDEWKSPSQDLIVPTGMFEFDQILFCGLGGIVLGGRYEIFGTKGSCKSTMAYRWMGSVQNVDGRRCAILDTERSHRKEFLLSHAHSQGAVVDRTDIFRPGNLDHTYRVMVELAESQEYSMIVWDSYGATIPRPIRDVDVKKYRKKEYGGKFQIAEGARANVAGIADVRDACFENNVLLLVVNQARYRLDMYRRSGPEIVPPGGHALHHAMNVIIFLARRYPIEEDGRVVGAELRAEVKESHWFPAGLKTGTHGGVCPDIQFYYDGRIPDPTANIVEAALKVGLIEQSGSWFTWDGERYQGKEALIEAVSPKSEELWAAVRARGEELLPDPNDEYAQVLNDGID